MMKALTLSGFLLDSFGLDRLDEDSIGNAEQFLVKVVATKANSECISFDQLRIKEYLHSKKAKFINLPCSSNEIRQNIKRAYYQTRMWLESPFGDARDFIDVENFGYDSNYQPIWFISPQRPLDIPEPCKNCSTCIRSSCPCRKSGYACSKYFHCRGTCKSPLNISFSQ